MPRNTIPAYFMLEGYWANVGGTETTYKPETQILKNDLHLHIPGKLSFGNVMTNAGGHVIKRTQAGSGPG
jgi:hypothetical protein